MDFWRQHEWALFAAAMIVPLLILLGAYLWLARECDRTHRERHARLRADIEGVRQQMSAGNDVTHADLRTIRTAIWNAIKSRTWHGDDK